MKQIGRYEEDAKSKKKTCAQHDQEIEKLKENSKNLQFKIEYDINNLISIIIFKNDRELEKSLSLCQKENIDQNLLAKIKLEESEKKNYLIQNDFEKTIRNLQDEIKIKEKEKVFILFIINNLLFFKD